MRNVIVADGDFVPGNDEVGGAARLAPRLVGGGDPIGKIFYKVFQERAVSVLGGVSPGQRLFDAQYVCSQRGHEMPFPLIRSNRC